ncbi:hypothetical protein KUW14_08725 [Pseudooceanicola nitratireducens]|uniref:hypothetical protein n=1 Tax=Pseudooceanicola nitratireducens TaxID=517719 RepID=UPI001C93BB43|nr:hypothetical protein [Pseudooceanicola nitratireducens]MBY6165926.1 hypothetical protein [Pseudooceanicola nitratireducens]
MALLMKLENVVTNKGKLVYRRRIPADLRTFYPKTFFETRFQCQEKGPAFVDEHHAYELAYAAMVDAARKRQPEALGLEGIDHYIQ